MAFNKERRAARYDVCGPHASLMIDPRRRQVSYGANFITRLPATLLARIHSDQRRGLDSKEMHYFMELARRDPPRE